MQFKFDNEVHLTSLENDLPAEQCQTESDASTCPTPTSSNCGLKKVVKLKIDHDGGRYFLTQETYTVVDSVEYPDLELHLNENIYVVDIYVERMRNWTLNEHRQPSDSLIPFNCGRRVIQNWSVYYHCTKQSNKICWHQFNKLVNCKSNSRELFTALFYKVQQLKCNFVSEMNGSDSLVPGHGSFVLFYKFGIGIRLVNVLGVDGAFL